MEAVERLGLARLTIDVDGSVVRTGAKVAWAFRGSIPITGRTSATIPSETSSRSYDASTAEPPAAAIPKTGGRLGCMRGTASSRWPRATGRESLAESHLTRRLFGQILRCIERLTWHPT